MSNGSILTSWRAVLGGLAVLLLLPLSARAAEIDLSTYQLQPNQAGQMISIYVTGGEAVNGVNFEIETGGGGPALGGSPAPKISNVDLLASGAVFENNNTNVYGSSVDNPGGSGQFWEAHVETQSGTVNLGIGGNPQLLAVVTFDTTGFTNGTFALKIDDPRQSTNFTYGMGNQLYPTVIDGFLQIGIGSAPEPASMALFAFACAGMLLRRRRNAMTPAAC